MNLDEIVADYQRKCELKDAEPLRGAATKNTVRVLEQLYHGLQGQEIQRRRRRPAIGLRSVVVLRFCADTPEQFVFYA